MVLKKELNEILNELQDFISGKITLLELQQTVSYFSDIIDVTPEDHQCNNVIRLKDFNRGVKSVTIRSWDDIKTNFSKHLSGWSSCYYFSLPPFATGNELIFTSKGLQFLAGKTFEISEVKVNSVIIQVNTWFTHGYESEIQIPFCIIESLHK